MVQKIFPSFFILVPLVFTKFLSKSGSEHFFRNERAAIHFASYLSFLLLYVIIFQSARLPAIRLLNTLLIPVLFSLCLGVLDGKSLLKIRSLVLAFFVLNSCLAISERIFTFHLFYPYTDVDLDGSGFRSTALQNHPLNNALITLLVMSFVLISNMKRIYQYLLMMLGLVAIISFGSRSSLAGFLLVIFVFVLKSFVNNTSSSSVSSRISLLTTMVIGFGGVYYFFIDSPFAERLINHSHFDDSADVRIQVFQVFGMLDTQKLLWGASADDIESIKNMIQIGVIENFWIIWIMRFGLIFTFLLLYFFVKFLFTRLHRFSLFDKIVTLILFLGVASTNNSLDSTTGVVSFFVICSHVFPKERRAFKLLKIKTNNVT